MTGFDETVPPDTDPSADGTAAENARDNVVRPTGGPEALEADGEDAPAPESPITRADPDERPMGGDDDIAAGHLGE